MTSETIAVAMLASGSTSSSCTLGSKSPERLLSELRRVGTTGPNLYRSTVLTEICCLFQEARAIEAATGGAHKVYARMMEKTYARRGKRRWELLDVSTGTLRCSPGSSVDNVVPYVSS